MQQLSNACKKGEVREECLHSREDFSLLAHVAKATTEMERSGIEVRCAIADTAGKEPGRGGESHDRDGAKRNHFEEVQNDL